MIRVTCEKCGYHYKLKDELARRRVKCKICQAVFTVPAGPQPPPQIDESPSGQPIYRHAERASDFQPACGDVENIDRISTHIQQHIGRIEMVFHEVISDLVHIDLHWVKPTPENPYHTLITSGMSNLPMKVPPGAENFRFAELMLSLPSEWPMTMDDFEDERHYWPLRLLKMLARFPHEYKTWLYIGHTVPNDDPTKPYAPNTRLCCALLMPPLLTAAEFRTLQIDAERTIHFYSLIPLYREEMEFKLASGFDSLIDCFDKHEISELLDVDRANVCAAAKKRGWF